MAIFPPWHMLASMSRKAAGLPDISKPTSNPSFISSFFSSAIDAGKIVADAPTADLMKQTGADERLEDVFIRLTAEQGEAA